ncbi:MAG: radical SAM protein [Deltaproteobacteria bacterium]|nr:radical SAM protein [Deltaproteobacteria bacterium]
MPINDFIKKSQDGGSFTKEELLEMLSYPSDSDATYQIMAEANRISKELTGNKAEVHAQFALNLAPCACNCLFCSFAKANGVFERETKITPEEAVANARQLEDEGANAVFLMTTTHYPFGQFLEISQEVRRNLKTGTTLIANVGDQSFRNALRMKEAGFNGVYHALRLREGTDTTIPPELRRESIRNFQEAGLKVGTCVEPLGPEHTNKEIAEMILTTGSFSPAYSGAARRIAIPGTEMERRGMISELRMAQIVAVTRLSVPRTVLGNCTHEPCTLGAIAGANLFWAEIGANPRDTAERTETGRGHDVRKCRTLFHESGWGVLDGPSRFYQISS